MSQFNMASAIRTVLFYFICLVVSVSGSLVNVPQNDALIFGPSVTLSCEADSATARVQWTEYITNRLGAPISDGDLTLPGHPNSARYSILHPTDTVYDLQIDPTVLADGGTYKCQDVNDGNPAYAQLVMIEAEPECVTNIPESGYVREDQYYTVECTINYRGNAAPVITWSGPTDYNVATTSTNTSVWSGISINMTRYMDSRQFEAKINFTENGFIRPNSAANIPTWNYTYSTAQLYVQWEPKYMYIVPEQTTYEIGEYIECHADANPSATYFFQNMDTHEIWNDYRLVITDRLVGTQQMRCNAANNISNVEYTNDLFFMLTVNPRTSTVTPTTPTTTTPPPAEAPCDELTGRWASTSPHAVDMCLEVNNTNYGRVLGIMRNATDPYFIEVRGRIVPYKFNQIGLTGVWPVNIGVLTFTGVCKKCHGVEMLQLNGIVRRGTDNLSCEDPGPAYYTADYLFYRTGPPCRELLAKHLHYDKPAK